MGLLEAILPISLLTIYIMWSAVHHYEYNVIPQEQTWYKSNFGWVRTFDPATLSKYSPKYKTVRRIVQRSDGWRVYTTYEYCREKVLTTCRRCRCPHSSPLCRRWSPSGR